MSLAYRSVSINPIDLMSRTWTLIQDDYLLFLGITFLAWLIGSYVPFYLLLGPMVCGTYYAYLKKMRGEKVELGDLFKGLDWFADSLIVSLVLLGITIVVLGFSYLFMFAGIIGIGAMGEEAAPLVIMYLGLAVLVIMVLALLIMVPFAFAYPLISEQGLEAGEAMQVSFAAARANLFGIIGLIVVITIVHLVASMLCFLPLFLVFPITYGSAAVLYSDVFPE